MVLVGQKRTCRGGGVISNDVRLSCEYTSSEQPVVGLELSSERGISRDLYAEKGTKTDYRKEYEELISVTDAKKPVALAEIGILPDMDMLEKSRVPWCYYMTWSKGFVMNEEFNSHKALDRIYDSKYAVTYPVGI